MIKYFILSAAVFYYSGCTNPFAPAFDETSDDSSVISDLKTIEGVFQNFKYAYTFKDTTIYGEIISHDFIFTYKDYQNEILVNFSWGREEEMRATYGLFQNTQRLDLVWNNIILSTTDSLNATVVRGFNLTVTINPTETRTASGSVNVSLRKDPATEKWAMVRWIDESQF